MASLRLQQAQESFFVKNQQNRGGNQRTKPVAPTPDGLVRNLDGGAYSRFSLSESTPPTPLLLAKSACLPCACFARSVAPDPVILRFTPELNIVPLIITRRSYFPYLPRRIAILKEIIL
ncbi:hypothetical protein U5922_018035 [Aquicoccus sp. G2-2]|uniref:hypothetical protein n=1 Tax=Aquicoccus sp. G2-2 TaxID=3092120 RepID=UPI002ADF477D|nr:hypothetical protein [Aquicoccus sp. G2-2]MEA1115272.1 hypothetical protein [Aquicoccus sp. G2-2]